MGQEKNRSGNNSSEEDNLEEFIVTPEQEAIVLSIVQSGKDLSYEQRRIWRVIGKRKWEEERKWCEANGIVRQVLLNNVCRTTPTHIENILKQWFIRMEVEKPELIEGFKLVKESFGPTVELNISFIPLGIFGGRGTIYVTPINDIEAQIEVICNGSLAPCMEREEAAELYWLTLDLLKALTKDLGLLFNVPINKVKISPQQIPIYPPGRSREPEFDKAFKEVQHYISVEKLSKTIAMQKAYDNYLAREKIKHDKYTSDNFRAAMNYRLRRDGLEKTEKT